MTISYLLVDNRVLKVFRMQSDTTSGITSKRRQVIRYLSYLLQTIMVKVYIIQDQSHTQIKISKVPHKV